MIRREAEQFAKEQERTEMESTLAAITSGSISLKFERDVSIPDGTGFLSDPGVVFSHLSGSVVKQGTTVKKIWRFLNNGTMPLPCGTALVCTDSPRIGLIPQVLMVHIPNVDPHQHCDVAVDFTMEAATVNTPPPFPPPHLF